jgi:hypothetical protein
MNAANAKRNTVGMYATSDYPVASASMLVETSDECSFDENMPSSLIWTY